MAVLEQNHSWRDRYIETPAFVLSLNGLIERVHRVAEPLQSAGFQVLFSAKAMDAFEAIRLISDYLDGISVSSVFEARLTARAARDPSCVWYASPLLREPDADAIFETCNVITFNSFSQFDRHRQRLSAEMSAGIRVNPMLSFASDIRFDPCRPNSKLGVPLPQLESQLNSTSERIESISGIHFHSNCESNVFGDLVNTICHVEHHLAHLLPNLRWLNVGGGYLFESMQGLEQLAEIVDWLTRKYGLSVFIEPGTALVRSAGYFVSTVEDVIHCGEFPVAILDLTVNHWPEVFEYQFEPDVEGHVDDGRYSYLLAGCSCLAGDLFGEYSFNEPLEVGSRLVFPNAGAYSIVKAHMFNGINLPNIYVLTEPGDLVLVKRFTYEDFASRCGVDTSAVVGT